MTDLTPATDILETLKGYNTNMFPETNRQQAEALLHSEEFASFIIDGFTLTARLVESGLQPVAREINGRWRWVSEPGYEVVFEGGKWGPHTLRCSVSSPERIRAHWDGYKSAHIQDLERRVNLRTVPAGTKKPIQGWRPKVGDKVYFPRGMYGIWKGRITAIRATRRWSLRWGKQGTLVADIAFTGANGNFYKTSCFLVVLAQNGKKPIIDDTLVTR